MALGAAFRAANLSNSFRVRQVGMTDLATYPIGVRLVDLSATEPKDNNDDDVETKQWMKRASLFSESHRLGLRKSVSFSHSNDISCTFRYDKPSMLPAGVSVQIAKFNITGVEKFAARMADKNLGEPKVTLSFELDSNGIAQIAKAEATLEEEVEVEVVVKKEKKSKKTKKDSSEDSSKADDEDEAEEEEKPETRMEKQTKTHREELTVVRSFEAHDTEEGMSVLPMSEAIKKESMRMLNEMETQSEVNAARMSMNAAADALNDLSRAGQIYDENKRQETKMEAGGACQADTVEDVVKSTLRENFTGFSLLEKQISIVEKALLPW